MIVLAITPRVYYIITTIRLLIIENLVDGGAQTLNFRNSSTQIAILPSMHLQTLSLRTILALTTEQRSSNVGRGIGIRLERLHPLVAIAHQILVMLNSMILSA